MSRWALMIGIDKYPNLIPPYQLNGCVNDQMVLKQLLIDRFQFPADRIELLTNEQATRARILDALDRLAGVGEHAGRSPIQEGDIVVISYAGHGSRLKEPPDQIDEPDGYDSTLVPCDSDRPKSHGKGGKNLDITDDELYVRFQKLIERVGERGHLLLYFDCCNSGSIDRDLPEQAVRELPEDDRYGAVERLYPAEMGSRDLGERQGRSGWLPLDKGYTLIAGCRRDEKAREHEDPATQQVHGALTYFLSQELARATGSLSYRDVFLPASVQVTTHYRSQHPQLEGESDRQLFGLERVHYTPFARLEAIVDERRVRLASGLVQGVTVGSRWAIVGPNLGDETPLAEVTIRQVDTLSSEAESEVPLPPAIDTQHRAIEVEHAWGDFQLPVAVEGKDGAALEAMRAQLRDSSLLTLPAQGAVEMIAVLLPERAGVEAAIDFAPELAQLNEPTWAVVGRDRHLLPLPPHAASEMDALQLTKENMENWARALHFRRLYPVRGNALGEAFQLRLFQVEDGQPQALPLDEALGLPIFESGKKLAVQIEHRYPQALFYTAFYLGPDGAIQPFFQSGPGNPLSPGIALNFPREGGIELTLPEKFPAVLPGGACAIKVLLTLEYADFEHLAQEGARVVDMHPARQLVAAAQQGARDLGLSEPLSTASSPPSWGVAQLDFSLKRAPSA